MKRLIFFLVLSIAGYAYLNNKTEMNSNVDGIIRNFNHNTDKASREMPKIINNWARDLGKAMDDFNWSTLPDADELLRNFEQSLNSFGRALRSSSNKEELNQLKDSMDNVLLKVETLDVSSFNDEQQVRFEKLLLRAQDLSDRSIKKAQALV